MKIYWLKTIKQISLLIVYSERRNGSFASIDENGEEILMNSKKKQINEKTKGVLTHTQT